MTSPAGFRRSAGDLGVLLVSVVAARHGGAPAVDVAPPVAGTEVAATEHFAVHSDPWINLHHFLYQWARADKGLGTGRQRVPVPERASLNALPASERRPWLQALSFYRDSVAARSHFDAAMLQEKRQLLDLGGDPAGTPPDVIPGIGAALAGAMPVYQSRWWPGHERANRGWVAAVVPILRRHEARYVELTERIYGARWPSVRFRVDVSAYANPRAGYTEPLEGHIVLYSTDAGNQGLYGLETLLHEVQHARVVGSAARDGLRGAFERAGAAEPANLWHGIIFATAGGYVQRVAQLEGLPVHVPYWIREGFETLRGWSAVVPATRDEWLPVVRGEATQADGFAALVRRFGTR